MSFSGPKSRQLFGMIQVLESVNLEGFVAIIPSVCVGNVGQLASDLLISSLNLKKFGYIWDRNVLALAGPDPYTGTNMLSTGFEVFISSSLRIIVFQIRTAIVNGSVFIRGLCNWLKENRVQQVIILSGTCAHERRDGQLLGEPLRYVFCPLTSIREEEGAKRRKWVELESKSDNCSSVGKKPLVHIPGSGLTVHLFNSCLTAEIPCSILLEFCSDGYNVPDALKLVNYLNEWLQLKEKHKQSNWTIPPSWNLLFGPSPPIEIFN